MLDIDYPYVLANKLSAGTLPIRGGSRRRVRPGPPQSPLMGNVSISSVKCQKSLPKIRCAMHVKLKLPVMRPARGLSSRTSRANAAPTLEFVCVVLVFLNLILPLDADRNLQNVVENTPKTRPSPGYGGAAATPNSSTPRSPILLLQFSCVNV